MTARELFLAGCRILGVYILWSGGQHVIAVINVVFGLYRPELSASASYGIRAVFDLTVGTYLLGGESLANLVYGRPLSKNTAAETSEAINTPPNSR